MKHNQAILEEIKVIVAKKQIALPRLSVAWVTSLGPHLIPLPGSSHVSTFDDVYACFR